MNKDEQSLKEVFMDIKEITKAVNDSFENNIETIRNFLKISNFIMEKEDINKAINFLCKELNDLNAKVEIKIRYTIG